MRRVFELTDKEAVALRLRRLYPSATNGQLAIMAKVPNTGTFSTRLSKAIEKERAGAKIPAHPIDS